MSEDNGKDIFSKRMNQFKKMKNESIEDEFIENDEINENLIENIVGDSLDISESQYSDIDSQVIEEDIQDESINSYNVETPDSVEEVYEDYSDNESFYLESSETDTFLANDEKVKDNFLNEDEFDEEKPKSLLEQFVLNAEDNIEEDLMDDLKDGKVSNGRDFINVEDEISDESIIETNLVSTNTLELELESEENSEYESENIIDDMLEDADDLLKEHKQMIEDELNNDEEAEDFNSYDESDDTKENDDQYNSYTQEEIDKKRNTKKSLFNKDLIIKVGVGIVFIVVIVMIAIFVRKLLNKKNNPAPDKTNTTNIVVTESPTPSIKNPSETVTIVDDILDDINTSDNLEEHGENIVEDLKEINTDINNSDEVETSSFIQNFKGYIVDIDDSELYVSDLSYDKYVELENDFNDFKESMPDSEDIQIMMDYDYSLNDKLNTVIYKKFSFLDLTEIPEWATIGSEVSVVYIQDKESLLNELIEIEKYETVDNSGTIINPSNKDDAGVDGTENEEDLTVGDNVWGENWDHIVARINDRRTKEETSKTDKNGNILDLENLELKESVTANIQIGNASIVWFKIGWKTNKDVKDVPNLEDVTVELQTSNGSLVNDSNIAKYGKKWVSEDKTINFVIKNTRAGNWGVVFTKDVGTYLGDVIIQAIPITGFLQIVDADATYTDGKLKVIWNAGGVKDDHCKVQIYARNGSKDVLMYSGNSIDDEIHTVDMVEIDASKIAGNTYDIIIKVTDIDATASTPKTIAATYITDMKIIEGIEIPVMK